MEAILPRRGVPVFEPKIPFLYNLGDECTDLTGGWVFPTLHTGTAYYWNVADYQSNDSAGRSTVTRQKNADNIELKIVKTSGTWLLGCVSVYTANAIDLTNYSKIHVLENADHTGIALNAGSPQDKFYWENKSPRVTYLASELTQTVYTDGEYKHREVDVSAIDGAYNVCLVSADYINVETQRDIKIYKVWLE